MSVTAATRIGDAAGALALMLSRHRSGPFLSTPCGVLAPLQRSIGGQHTLTIIAREDSAVGVAAGAALAGHQPVVLMQNSGFGQCVNAFASLVLPYALDVITVVSMRGIAPDSTEENIRMGVLTPKIMVGLDADYRVLDSGADVDERLDDWVAATAEPACPRFLLIAPGLFGWHP